MSAMLLTAMVLLISLVVCDVVLMLMINSYAEGIPDQFAFYLTSLTTVMVALQTAAWALVLLAVFSGRQYPQGRELLAKPRGAVPDLPADAICE
jgi:hypothetical protein